MLPTKLPRTPSGESLLKLRRLARTLDNDPKMRNAIAAALKAMGLAPPIAQKAPPAG